MVITQPTSSDPRAASRHPHAAATLRALRGNGARSLSELVTLTGLSRPSIATAVENLVGEGWLVALRAESDPNKSAGRPARRFRFRAESSVIAGVDVGLHKILVLLADLDENLVAELQVDISENMSGVDRVDAVVETIGAAIATLPLRPTLLAASIGAPGVIDRSGRIVVSPPLRAWDGIDLAAQLSGRLSCPVFVENDAMAAAVGENRYGAGRGTRDFVYLLAGHRISSASIINGSLHRGFSGAAGMVGEMEQLRWSTAPERLVGKFTAADGSTPSLLEVFAWAANGEHNASRAVDEYLDDLAFGLAAVALAVDPELVVIGGGVSLAGPEVATTLRARLAHHAKLVNPRVEVSALGNHATARGSLRIALDHVERSLLGVSPS